ncbi:dUTPase-like protein [Lipomyces oligophaga]|uniref:dUTPase-like protein n=1 Tax=Lipomyces oligophaga TaxID=45792 RepID=UPI0034CDEAE6
MTAETISKKTKLTLESPGLADQNPQFLVKLLSPRGRVPTRGSALAAGYDLYASADGIVPARGSAMIPTDISIALPADTYGRVAARSGMATKHSIQTGAGVVDSDYRGPIKVLLFNCADVDYAVSEGDRIAQMVVERIVTPPVLLVEELPDTVRGESGFGSTGGFAGVPTTI